MTERILLTPEHTERVAQLKVRAQGVVEGVLSGLHRSPHHGQSVEFAEHKEYAPGDEIRHIDWKAFGKFDKYYVKRFEHETNLRAFIVIDASASMGFCSEGPQGRSKLDIACTLAAAFSYLLVRQQDAVGLLVLQGENMRYVPPRAAAGHLNTLLDELSVVQPEGTTNLAAAAEFLSEKARRRAAVMLFSDLFDTNDRAVARMLQLRHQKNELALFHVLDPAELTFPYDDPTQFLSMEDSRQLQAHPAEIRESYLEEFGAFLEATRRTCAESRVNYELVRTDAQLDRVMISFLARLDATSSRASRGF
jgi:uncharacterized protein (DUF58 family)